MGGLRGGREEGEHDKCYRDRGNELRSRQLRARGFVESWFKICNSNSARPDNYQLIGTTAINSRWAARHARVARPVLQLIAD